MLYKQVGFKILRMASFKIQIAANVNNTFGANVYAVAFKEEYAMPDRSDDIMTYVQNHKGSAGVVQLHVLSNPGVLDVVPSIDADTITVEGEITTVYANLSDNTGHNIPYVFSEYSVYVVAENYLSLVSAGYGGRRNAYSNVLSEADIVINRVIAFEDYISTDDYSKNRLQLTANITNFPSGNIVQYYIVGFVNADEVDSATAVWYVDQSIDNNDEFGTNQTVVSGNVTVPEVAILERLTHVVGNDVTDSRVVFEVNDVNTSIVYIIARDLGQGASVLTPESKESYQMEIESGVFSEPGNVSHARIKDMRFDYESGNVIANFSAYSAYSPPTSMRVLAVERNALGIDTRTVVDAAFMNEHGTLFEITSGAIRNVYTLSDFNMRTALTAVSPAIVFSTIDSSREYDMVMLLQTDDASKNDLVYMLSNAEAPHQTQSSIGDSYTHDRPRAILQQSGIVFDTPLQGNISTYTHQFVPHTDVYLVASTNPGMDMDALLSNVDTSESYVQKYAYTDLNMDITAPFEFSTLMNSGSTQPLAAANIEDVHVLTLYPWMVVDGDSANTDYFIQKIDASKITLTRADFSDTDDMYARTDSLTLSYNQLSIDVKSVFNYRSNGNINKVYVFATKTAVDILNINDYLSYIDTQVGMGNVEYGSVIDLTADAVTPYEARTLSAPVVTVQYVLQKQGVDVQAMTLLPETGTDYHMHVVGVLDDVFPYEPFNKVISSTKATTEGAGVENMTVQFEPTSGNIEVTNLNMHAQEDGSILHVAAFTYDVLQYKQGSIAEFHNAVYEAASTVTREDLASGPHTISLYINSVVDSNDDTENAYSTPTAYVYAWVSDGNNVNPMRSAVFKATPLGAVDRIYPFIPSDESSVVYDGTNVTVTGASIMLSGSVSETDTIDKYYIFGVNQNVTPSITDQALFDTFATTIERNPDLVGFYEDIEPNVSVNDIFVNTTTNGVSFTQFFTDYENATYTDPNIGEKTHIVLLVKTAAGECKSYVRPFDVPSTVGLRNVDGAFTSDSNVRINAGTAYQDGTGANIRAVAYTSILANKNDAKTAISAAVSTTSMGASTDVDLSVNTINFTNAIDKAGDVVVISQVDSVYVYMWVESTTSSSSSPVFVTEIIVNDSNTKQVYITGVTSTEDNHRVLVDGSLFTSKESSGITAYYVALFESTVTLVGTDDDIIATFVVDNASSAAVYANVGITINQFDVVSFENAPVTRAFSSFDPTPTIADLKVDTAYKTCVVARYHNDGIDKYSVFTSSTNLNKSNFGLKTIDFEIALHLADGAMLDITKANTKDALDAEGITIPTTYKLAAFTYEIPESDLDTYNTTITTGVANITFAGAANDVLANVQDIGGEVVSIRNVDAVYAYAWAEYTFEGSVVRSAVVPARDQITSTDPYPRIMSASYTENATIEVTDATIFSANGNIDKYYVFATVAGQDITPTNIANIEANPTFMSGVSSLGTVHDFVPDVIEGDLHRIPTSSISQAFTDVSNPLAVTEIIAGVSYNVHLVVFAVDGEGGAPIQVYTYTSLGSKSKTALHPHLLLNANVDLDIYTVNHHMLNFTIDELNKTDAGSNVNVYAMISTQDLYASAASLDDFNTTVRAKAAELSLTPILSDVDGLAPDEEHMYTLDSAYDATSTDAVPLYTVNSVYLYVWAESLDTPTPLYSTIARDSVMDNTAFTIDPTSRDLGGWAVNTVALGSRLITDKPPHNYMVNTIQKPEFEQDWLLTTNFGTFNRNLIMTFHEPTRVYAIFNSAKESVDESWTPYTEGPILFDKPWSIGFLQPNVSKTGYANANGTTTTYYKDVSAGYKVDLGVTIISHNIVFVIKRDGIRNTPP